MAAPHYRLYMNALGGGSARAGSYFPQDEFYDAYMRDVMNEIARACAPRRRGRQRVADGRCLLCRASETSGRGLPRPVGSGGTRQVSAGRFVIDARGANLP